MSNNNYRNDSMSSSMSSSSYRGGSNQHRDRGGDRRGGGGGSRRGGRQPSNINSLPFEQGIICSLKESFGFVHCAERPEEIFFHYSEVTNCHPDDLKIDTEVEFKVGSSSGGGGGGGGQQKLAAFQIQTVQTGTVVWETEEKEGHFYKGSVEKQCVSASRSIRDDRDRDGGRSGNGPQTDGTIRIIEDDNDNNSSVDDSNDGGDDKDTNNNYQNVNENKEAINDGKNNKSKKNKNKNGPIVRLRAGEYSSAAKRESIESSINSSSSSSNSKGSNKLFRGDLVEFRVFLDRRTKQKYARQITLLQSDRERKRIEKENKLLETASAEEGIVVALNNGFGFIKSNKRREDIYFHYSELTIPTENNEGDNNNNKNDEFELKKGQEVKFLVVTELQAERQNSSSNIKVGKSNRRDSSSNIKVSARQIHCLPKGSVVFQTVEAKGVKGVVMMVPHPPSPGSKNDDSKMGKVRLMQQHSSASSSIEEDILLHFSDTPGGVFSYQNHRNQAVSALWVHEGDTLLFDVVKETVDGSYRAIPTLHKIGLGGSVLEPYVADDNDDENENGKVAERPSMRLVSLSMVGRAEGVIHTLKPDFGFIHFAERPVDVHFKTYDLMPNELQDDIRRNMGIEEPIILNEEASVHFDICAHGNITTTANRGRRRGGLQARENIRGQRVVILPKSAVTLEKYIATSAKGVIKSTNPQQAYTGVVELEEDVKPMTIDERHPLVAKMIDSFLEESSLPNGRKSLVFRDTLGMNDDDVIVEMARIKGQGVLECSHIPVPGIAPHPGRICIRRVEKKEDVDMEAEVEVKEEAPKEVPKGKRKGKQTERVYKNIRYEKSSLDEALKDDIPPSPGDIITCDVIQDRRTGICRLKNLKIVERKFGEGNPAVLTPTESSGVGVVKDVVIRRQFGFISVLDENNAKSELLFFHLPKDRRFMKGNEVKFDIAMEGSKRIALNVESVPKGTIPSAASNNACLGYILMEPSHTTLSNTPVRKTTKAGSDKLGNGRWAKTNNDDTRNAVKKDMVEDGCILLLEDKTGMFQKKRNIRRKKRSESVDSTDSSGDLSIDETKSVESGDGISSDDELSSDDECREDNGIVSRISYKNGSIAIHGAGSTSSMDGSVNPKRGDLVSFIKGRKRMSALDIRIVKRDTAILQRGRLENIRIVDTEDKKNKGKAQFIAATEKQEVYDIDLADVVSCAASILKKNESVEGVLHEGKVYGLCRTSDLYLTSKIVGSGKNRQRPKLNLVVKKNRGGTIMAQSMMGKGPDGTIGFKAGWTNRVSLYAIKDEKSEVEIKGEEEGEAGAEIQREEEGGE